MNQKFTKNGFPGFETSDQLRRQLGGGDLEGVLVRRSPLCQPSRLYPLLPELP